MRININSNAAQEALDKVNGRAKEHTYQKEDLGFITRQTEVTLRNLGIPKAKWKGAEVYATSGTQTTGSYKWRRKATAVRLLRGGSGWFLIEAQDTLVGVQGGGGDTLYLTREQDEIAVANLRKGYRVQQWGENV